MLMSGLKRCLLCFKKGQYQVNLLTLLTNKFSKLYTIKPVLRRALLCKGFIQLYCENFIFIYSSTKLHKYIILYWGEHFLFNNIQGCKRGTVFIDAVIFWIQWVEMLYDILVRLTKSFDERLSQSKQEIVPTGSDRELSPGMWMRLRVKV